MLNVLVFCCLSLTPVFCSPAWSSRSAFLYLNLLIKDTSKPHEIMKQNHYLGYMITNILVLYFYTTFNDFSIFPWNTVLLHTTCLFTMISCNINCVCIAIIILQCFNFIYACLNRTYWILLINSNTAKCNHLNY